MATLTKGHTFASGDTVTATKLNDLVDSATIAAIQTADISDNQITTAKIVDANVTDAKLATGAVTGAAGGGKLAASAISGQTAITTLADDDEFIVHDDNDSTLKKITKANLSSELVGDGSINATKLNGVAQDGAGSDLAVGNPPVFGCRAWVNFNGTRKFDDSGASTNGSNVLIRASGNVSSVLKNGTGDYTITFTTAMPDANYGFTVNGQRGDGAGGNQGFAGLYGQTANGYTPTSSTLRIVTTNSASSGNLDFPAVSVAIFR